MRVCAYAYNSCTEGFGLVKRVSIEMGVAEFIYIVWLGVWMRKVRRESKWIGKRQIEV